MPRRNSPPKRAVMPDNKYNNIHVAMFINRMMKGGKKSTASKIMYTAFDIIEERAKKSPVEVFEQAIRNVTPAVEVKPKRVGGSTYQVPLEVPPPARYPWPCAGCYKTPTADRVKEWL